MKYLRLLPLSLVFIVALKAEQSMPVEGAPFELVIPDGWIRIPEKAMSRFRQPTPGFKTNYIAGFAGPRPPPQTPMTVMLVQLLPANVSSKDYLDSVRAGFAQARIAEPSLVKEDLHIGLAGRAAIGGMHGDDGRMGRSYAFPTSGGLIEFSLFCPAANAPATFSAVESCLQKLKLSDGTHFDLKWIADLQKSLPPAPKRAY